MSNTKLKRAPNFYFNINRIDQRILEIRKELIGKGHDCYLVGGCIRDFISKKQPKDFDLVTSARPDAILKVFKKRARLVGNRFPIVHVRKGDLVVEIATFRSANSLEIDYNKTGSILRDESFGVIEEDFSRRDFTINALYFDPDKNEILDFVNGIGDLNSRKLKFIGNPETRVREDPIRLLRYLRFAAKLDFELDDAVISLLKNQANLLTTLSSARLFDEFKKIFLQGHAFKVWKFLISTRIPSLIWPDCETDNSIIFKGLKETDKRFNKNKPLSPAFIIALLLWPTFEKKASKGNPAELETIGRKMLKRQNTQMKIPLRYREFILSIWKMQTKLTNKSIGKKESVMRHRSFRASYDLLAIRSQVDHALKDSFNFWSHAQLRSSDKKTRSPKNNSVDISKQH